MIQQQDLVDKTYELLAEDARAMTPALEAGDWPPGVCRPGCVGCATTEAFTRLAMEHADRWTWDPFEVGACICAAVSQISHELEHPQ